MLTGYAKREKLFGRFLYVNNDDVNYYFCPTENDRDQKISSYHIKIPKIHDIAITSSNMAGPNWANSSWLLDPNRFKPGCLKRPPAKSSILTIGKNKKGHYAPK